MQPSRARALFATISTALAVAGTPVWATEITVTSTSGEVKLLERGHSVAAAVGATLTLPVEVHTGTDGNIDFQQLGSKLHIGPNSTVAMPDAGPQGSIVERIKQSAGYVLYNIKSRKTQPLSVETPYLAAVVKGTMFTIAVQEHAAEVALMEGSLDISAPGVAQHVLLKPNESIRHADGEPGLTVQSATSRVVEPHGGSPTDTTAAWSDPSQSDQMAVVAKDLADAGAAVSTSRVLAASKQPTSTSGTTAISSGTSSSGSTSPSTTSGSTGSTTTSGASSVSSSATTSSSNGSSSSNTGSVSSSGTTSSTSGSSSSTGGSTSDSSTTSTSTSGSSSSSTGSSGGTVGCNGKTNGTGAGNCLGHKKP